MKLFVSTSDMFGDILGAHMLRCLQKFPVDVEAVGVGGPILRSQGVDLAIDSQQLSAIGLSAHFMGKEAGSPLAAIGRLGSIATRIRDRVEDFRPDALVMIMSPGINLALSQMLASSSIKKIYILPPETWAWSGFFGAGRRRSKVLFGSDLIVTGFQFEQTLLSELKNRYQGRGGAVKWFGHPVADCPVAQCSLATLKTRQNLDPDQKIIGLFPGSRPNEIRELLPIMLEAASLLTREHRLLSFALPVAGFHLRDLVEETVAPYRDKLALDVLYPDEETPQGLLPIYQAMACSEAAMVASGTASLELMLHGVPSVVCYRLREASWPLVSRSGLVRLKTKFIALPNVLAREEICPELIQERLTVNRLTEALSELIADPARLRLRSEKLRALGRSLGEPGVMNRITKEMLSLIDPETAWIHSPIEEPTTYAAAS
jgi:lipid-A-disaccharide synthase